MQEQYEEALKALEAVDAVHAAEKKARLEIEHKYFALQYACEEQTDAIVSLESDLRLAVQARDMICERFERMQESAAVSELERIVGLEAECSKLRKSLHTERTNLRTSLDQNLGLQLKLRQASVESSDCIRYDAGAGDIDQNVELNHIAEELEVAAMEWRSKYCDLRLKAEAHINKVKTTTQLLCAEVASCSELCAELCTEAEATRLWLETGTYRDCAVREIIESVKLEQVKTIQVPKEDRGLDFDKDRCVGAYVNLIQTQKNMPADQGALIEPSEKPGTPSMAWIAQCRSPPSLSPDVTARLRAEMSSARVQRGLENRTSAVNRNVDDSVGKWGAAVQIGDGCGNKDGRGVSLSQQQPVQVILNIEPLVVCDCKRIDAGADEAGTEHGDVEKEKSAEEARNSTTKTHLLESELKAIRMEYDRAKDRWQRERDALIGELAEKRALSEQDVVSSGNIEGQITHSIGHISFAASNAGSRPGSMDGNVTELKALKNEYLSAQIRWDKERDDLQSQFRNVLQVLLADFACLAQKSCTCAVRVKKIKKTIISFTCC